jgi:hypothetical protein
VSLLGGCSELAGGAIPPRTVGRSDMRSRSGPFTGGVMWLTHDEPLTIIGPTSASACPYAALSDRIEFTDDVSAGARRTARAATGSLVYVIEFTTAIPDV